MKLTLIELAIELACRAHRDQVRKGTDLPYISHPFGVALLLCRAGCDEEMIAAGILHDTVEDTRVTLDEIRKTFGNRVGDIVEGCSEPEKSRPWEERKAHTIRFLKDAPLDIKIVSCADKLHNLRSIAADRRRVGESVWDRFNRGREKQAWYYLEILRSLESRPEDLDDPAFSQILDSFRKEVKSLFPED
ncbi:MAG: bifunctional (p)ppGpp synthetase/guanosine-3',5'-bis(diphosphate) 3'-pyrophosphohydrolase [Deltaproteobacteria bacterium]|nr:bifunctional (p)ppGpp synthetase/guanosine-3',5'-bis(diphosphate) 3'-pyrophosphohydrolase [Deltaproteobacteria bacterium]MBW2130434.1 bifunctional (p)ppGpp synthetase/guanosine-3',5'-bis(diphosphate) 3'-pyrophosphohydrolase [Deltaproteobacteria bacterium]MBW2303818.1 bifunctional (p)ppGpp synthetase/guanosine-3',5'-bis(diphosphate) 3'-pyrophosphohydrolase [Deltaproteobacteria bacterium]